MADPDERVLATRSPTRGDRVGAVAAVAAAIGATLWAYLEYAGPARTAPLALALSATFFALGAAVLLGFRAAFPFESVQAPRPCPPATEPPIDLGSGDLGKGARRWFLAIMAGAASSLAALLLLPLRSLGTWPRPTLRATAWRRGVRLLTADGATLRPADVPPGSATPVVPEGAADDGNSPAVLVRLRASGQLRAYSRICTHAGCAVCVFRSEASQLVCPCHHSTFDAAAGGRIVSGPASQPLPELPLAVDAGGWLIADGDFDRPIGPRSG